MLHKPSSSIPVRARRLGLFALLCVAGLLAIGSACDPSLESIAVTGQKTSLAKGTAVQLKAQGTFADGSNGDISGLATWSSADAAVITVSAGGLATGLAAGQTTVVATYKGVTGSLSLTITASTLTSVTVWPSVASIAKGTTQGFTAVGSFSDGTTQEVTSTATWSVDPAVATLAGPTPSALTATGLAAGQTPVKAVLMGQTGGATLVVTNAALLGLTVSPSVVSLAKGVKTQLKATGFFSDQTNQDLTSLVTWQSANSGVAGVTSPPAGPPSGLVTAEGPGTALVTAALGPIHGSASFTVTTATLVSIAVTPQAPVLAKGTGVQVVATGTFSDGTSQPLTGNVTWTSLQTGVGTVSGDGVGQVSAVSQGTATLTATVMGVSGTATLTVTDASLTSIVVSSVLTVLPKGVTTQLTATGIMSDNNQQDLTSQVAWQGDPAVVLIDKYGLLTAQGPGPADVTAVLGAVTSLPLSIIVNPAKLVSIAVTPPTPQSIDILTGASVQLTATGTYSDGMVLPITDTVGWQSSDYGIAGVTVPGRIKGFSPGVAIITAIDLPTGTKGTIAISVSADVPTLASLVITPTPAFVAPGGTVGFTATGIYSDGTQQDLSSQVTWTSDTPSVATISNDPGTHGLASAVAMKGLTYINANLKGITSGFVPLTIAKRLFMIDPINGGDLGGVSGADVLCMASLPAGVVSARAVLSDGMLRVACKTANCSEGGPSEHTDWPLSPSTQYILPDGTAIGSTNPIGLLNFPLQNGIPQLSSGWYSGLQIDWTSAGDNCLQWGAIGANANVGNPSAADQATFLSNNNATFSCQNSFGVICAEQ